ncbi:hypothetical protein ACFW21_28885 [Streptomyces albogriseolus]|jgi:hypothetical protein|uniref:hypothetical protein n=1 Tax=Streptomyces albogriseolus TaxID=1887 RepID=UPI0036AABCCF
MTQWAKDPETCDHSAGFIKERILGAQTGDYICNGCGEDFTPAERKAILDKRQAEQSG